MTSESRVPENGTPGLMSGDWKPSTVSGPQRLQLDAWTAVLLAVCRREPVECGGAIRWRCRRVDRV